MPTRALEVAQADVQVTRLEGVLPAGVGHQELHSCFHGWSTLEPIWEREYLWGNVPALDLLNVKDNEGAKDVITQDLSLLFAASGDIRNVVKSIVGIPEEYQGQCTVVINDINFSIVARNAIMLLTTLQFQPEVAAPMIIHLWYSVLLPASMLQALQDSILPYIEDVCTKIKGKAGDSLQAKTFSSGIGLCVLC